MAVSIGYINYIIFNNLVIIEWKLEFETSLCNSHRTFFALWLSPLHKLTLFPQNVMTHRQLWLQRSELCSFNCTMYCVRKLDWSGGLYFRWNATKMSAWTAMGTAEYVMDRQQNQVYISKIPILFVLLMCCVATLNVKFFTVKVNDKSLVQKGFALRIDN